MRENNPVKIYVHHTAVSRTAQPKQFLPVNRYHEQEFGNYCKSSMGYFGGYHILIEPDGTEYRYREDLEESCAQTGHNTTALSVCLSGNFDIETPTDAQIATLKRRLRKWVDKYHIGLGEVYPHRSVANKTCYGSLLPDEWAMNLLSTGKEDEVKDLQNKLDALWLVVIELQKLLRAMFKK
jgi:N-acetylmuramoyl-L-alanine amidase